MGRGQGGVGRRGRRRFGVEGQAHGWAGRLHEKWRPMLSHVVAEAESNAY